MKREDEDPFKNIPKISVYDFIGRPAFKLVNEMSDKEIKSGVKILMDLLYNKRLDIGSVFEIGAKELYRFITEEIFKTEISDIVLEGLRVFAYDNYHPNNEFGIEWNCNDFFGRLLDEKMNFKYLTIASEFYAKDGVINKEVTIKKIDSIRKIFSSFELNHYFKINSMEINNDTADVNFELCYSAIIADSNKKRTFSGFGNFQLKHEDNDWNICKVDMPGMAF
ncbi:MAG: hypothetical protein K8R85_11995 [Bacteroidetes bacterium]|nr:hypothetical protein [Bacteroidota bacterium]